MRSRYEKRRGFVWMLLPVVVGAGAGPAAAGTVSLVSRAVGPGADTGGGTSVSSVAPRGSVSSDGRYVAFLSTATNLVAGQVDTNVGNDVFLRDRTAGTTVLVSRSAAGAATAGNGVSDRPVVSDDGRYVAFLSRATDLVAGQTDGNGGNDVFLFDSTTGQVTLVSLSAGSSATTGNGASDGAVLAAGGAAIAFASVASDLVAGQVDSNAGNDVFLYDVVTGSLALLSHANGAAPGTAGNGLSEAPSLSADGNFVAFASRATDLAAGWTDSNSASDVVLLDRAAGTLALVSRTSASATTTANGASDQPVVSADGSRVAFRTLGTNLGATDTNSVADFFLFTRAAGTHVLVSRSSSSMTTAANGAAGNAVLSADGRYVAYESLATNSVSSQSDSNWGADVFVFDATPRTQILVSRRSGSTAGTGSGPATVPSISADGAYVAYTSTASNVVSGQSDTNSVGDVFLFDRAAATTAVVSHRTGSAVAVGNAVSDRPVLATGGGFVLYASLASNLETGLVDSNGFNDAYAFERATGANTAVSRRAAASPSQTPLGHSHIANNPAWPTSADGRYVVFVSDASNVDAGITDTNTTTDIFLLDRQTGGITLVSHSRTSHTVTAYGTSNTPVISADGNWVAFTSYAADLITGFVDGYADQDLYLWSRATGALTLISHRYNSATTGASGRSTSGSISADGRFVVYGNDGTDLVTGQVEGSAVKDNDVFLFDRTTGASTLVSHASSSLTQAGNGASVVGRVSADGRYVVFASLATDHIAGVTDANAVYDIYLWERATGTLTLVSHKDGFPAITGHVASPGSVLSGMAISNDGGYVAFSSLATDLVSGQVDTNGINDVFLFERATGTNRLASHTPAGPAVAGNGISYMGSNASATLAADGSVLAFVSLASDLAASDSNAGTDVFTFERAGGTVSLVSAAAGSPGTAASSFSYSASIDGSGRFVAFQSQATNLVTGQVDTNQDEDAFLFDRVAGRMELLSHAAGSPATAGAAPVVDGMPSNVLTSGDPLISRDGTVVAFPSFASNLVDGDHNARLDAFVYVQTLVDLEVTKSDGVTQVSPAGSLTYTITATNQGPSAALGARVIDTFPADLTAISWTCAGTSGGICGAASGAGDLDELVDLPVGGSVTYTVSATVGSFPTDPLVNTVEIEAPAEVIELDPADNVAVDSDAVVP